MPADEGGRETRGQELCKNNSLPPLEGGLGWGPRHRRNSDVNLGQLHRKTGGVPACPATSQRKAVLDPDAIGRNSFPIRRCRLARLVRLQAALELGFEFWGTLAHETRRLPTLQKLI